MKLIIYKKASVFAYFLEKYIFLSVFPVGTMKYQVARHILFGTYRRAD